MKRVFLASLLVLFCASNGMAADRNSEKIIERKVDSIFRKLSTREKIAQIMVVDLWSGDSPARKKDPRQACPQGEDRRNNNYGRCAQSCGR